MQFLLFSSIVFALALCVVEIVDSKGTDLTDKPISHYFSTSTAIVQDAMFLVMALALWIRAYELGNTSLAWSLATIGVGLAGAMSTDTWSKAFFGYDREIHYTGAALCFIGGFFAMLAYGTYTYALSYLLGALLMVAIDKKHTSVQEKLGTLMIIVWVFGYAAGIR